MTDPGVQNKELSSAVVVGSGGLREGLGGAGFWELLFIYFVRYRGLGRGGARLLSLSPPPLMDFCAQIQQRFDF